LLHDKIQQKEQPRLGKKTYSLLWIS